MPRSLLLFVMAITGSVMLGAAPLYVSASGRFSNTDVASPLVTPDGVFSLSFVIDSNPTPIPGTVTTLGFDPLASDFHYTLNGVGTAASADEIRFNTLTNGGLFDVTFGSGLTASEFSFTGDQAFSGSTSAPVFAQGQFALSSWTFSSASNFDVQSTTGASVMVTPTPEPSCIATVVGGFTAIFFFARRRSGRTNTL